MANTDSTPTKKFPKLIGYLTFVSFPSVGVVGGMLLVNELARPVAFHCTAPVPESRVHEILYGSTHRVSLYSDQIGKALFNHAMASDRLALLITDEAAALELRTRIDLPLALLRHESEDESQDAMSDNGKQSGANQHLKASQDAGSSPTEERRALTTEWSLELGGYSFTNSPTHPEDCELIRDRLMRVTGNWDLAEPFQRIRDAIEEAQRAAA